MEETTNFSETKVKLKLGEKEHLLNFGIYTRRRIEEKKPDFGLFNGSLPDFEILPFLIQNAVEPEDQNWKDEKEFIALYEECTDADALAKIPLAFQNSVGFTNQAFIPLMQRVSAMIPATDQTQESK